MSDESVIKHLDCYGRESAQGLQEWQQLLLKAAAAIEDKGHRKRDLGAPERGFCALGALSFAANGVVNHDEEPPAFYEVTTRLMAHIEGPISYWNNNPERSPQEVISTLRRVALGG